MQILQFFYIEIWTEIQRRLEFFFFCILERYTIWIFVEIDILEWGNETSNVQIREVNQSSSATEALPCNVAANTPVFQWVILIERTLCRWWSHFEICMLVEWNRTGNLAQYSRAHRHFVMQFWIWELYSKIFLQSIHLNCYVNTARLSAKHFHSYFFYLQMHTEI